MTHLLRHVPVLLKTLLISVVIHIQIHKITTFIQYLTKIVKLELYKIVPFTYVSTVTAQQQPQPQQ